MIETFRHKAKGETRIWTGISLVSLLLPKKNNDDKTPQNQVEMIFVKKNNMFSKRFNVFSYTFVSFHQETVPTSCRNNGWVQTSR